MIDYKDLQILEDMSYIEKPMKNLDTEVKVLKTKPIPVVKILWWNYTLEAATGKLDSDIKIKYLGSFLGQILGRNFFKGSRM